MIKFLTSWIEEITISIVIVNILEMILPKGNIKKYAKIVLNIFVVFCIISPFVNYDNIKSIAIDDINTYIEKKEDTSKIEQNSIDSKLQELYIEELENKIKLKVEELGFNVKECNVKAELDSNKTNAGINKIDILISKYKSSNNINKIEEIKITEDNSKQENTNNEIINLKKEISKEYEVNENIIEIIQR